MNECICIKNHYRSYDNTKYRFIRNKIYRLIILELSIDNHRYFILTENYDEKLGLSVENFNNFFCYTNEQFEKYYTTELKVIRKQKLEKIKKVVHF